MSASRWQGVLLSFLVPGAGQFLAGKRVNGIAWHVSLYFLHLAGLTVASRLVPFGLFASFALLLLWFALWVVMMVDSYRPVPRKHWSFLLLFLVLGIVVWRGERTLAVVPVRIFRIPAGSMAPTLVPGDRVFVVRDSYRFAAYRRGEVVIFRTPDIIFDPERPYYVKRIAGMPGERISFSDGRLLVNGEQVDGPPIFREPVFRTNPRAMEPEGPPDHYDVPGGEDVMLGDSGQNSYDSRYWGTVPRENLIGEAIFICWPPDRMGVIE